MHINPEENIQGYPAVQIRNMLRRWMNYEINLQMGIQDFLGCSKSTAVKIKRFLLENKLLEKGDYDNKLYKLTLDGRRFAKASANKKLNRETATSLIISLLDRVQEVNQNNYYMYKVSRIFLFGSYLNKDLHKLSDIDLALETERKKMYVADWEEISYQRLSEAIARGRRFSNFTEELFWPDTEVRLYLQNKSKYLSFTAVEDAIFEKANYLVLYDADMHIVDSIRKIELLNGMSVVKKHTPEE